MGRYEPGCYGPLEPGLSHRQRRKVLCSPARRTGFPAAGHKNIPSHCPYSYHRESLCSARDNVNSYPGNQGKQLGFFGILHGAAACLPCEQGPAGTGRRCFSWALMNLPGQLLVGHQGGKSVAAQGKNLYLRQTSVVATGRVCSSQFSRNMGLLLALGGQVAAMAGWWWVPGNLLGRRKVSWCCTQPTWRPPCTNGSVCGECFRSVLFFLPDILLKKHRKYLWTVQ